MGRKKENKISTASTEKRGKQSSDKSLSGSKEVAMSNSEDIDNTRDNEMKNGVSRDVIDISSRAFGQVPFCSEPVSAGISSILPKETESPNKLSDPSTGVFGTARNRVSSIDGTHEASLGEDVDICTKSVLSLHKLSQLSPDPEIPRCSTDRSSSNSACLSDDRSGLPITGPLVPKPSTIISAKSNSSVTVQHSEELFGVVSSKCGVSRECIVSKHRRASLPGSFHRVPSQEDGSKGTTLPNNRSPCIEEQLAPKLGKSSHRKSSEAHGLAHDGSSMSASSAQDGESQSSSSSCSDTNSDRPAATRAQKKNFFGASVSTHNPDGTVNYTQAYSEWMPAHQAMSPHLQTEKISTAELYRRIDELRQLHRGEAAKNLPSSPVVSPVASPRVSRDTPHKPYHKMNPVSGCSSPVGPEAVTQALSSRDFEQDGIGPKATDTWAKYSSYEANKALNAHSLRLVEEEMESSTGVSSRQGDSDTADSSHHGADGTCSASRERAGDRPLSQYRRRSEGRSPRVVDRNLASGAKRPNKTLVDSTLSDVASTRASGGKSSATLGSDESFGTSMSSNDAGGGLDVHGKVIIEDVDEVFALCVGEMIYCFGTSRIALILGSKDIENRGMLIRWVELDQTDLAFEKLESCR